MNFFRNNETLNKNEQWERDSDISCIRNDDLLQLYEQQNNAREKYDIPDPLLSSEEEAWAREMSSVQRNVEMRLGMIGGDINEAAARLMFGIVKGHKLSDGNKRSSIFCMVSFYFINKYTTTFNPEDIYNKVKEIAALDSQTIDDDEEIKKLAAFLKDNTEPFADKDNGSHSTETDNRAQKEQNNLITMAAEHIIKEYGQILARLAKE